MVYSLSTIKFYVYYKAKITLNNNNFGYNSFNSMMMGQPNFFSQGNSYMNKEQLKEKYKTQIKAIKDMGFDNEEKIINALQKTNVNINASIERLINNLN